MGKWTKTARERHSVRMKERWKAKMQAQGNAFTFAKQAKHGHTDVSTISQRLEIVTQQLAKIKSILGE